MRCSTVVVTPNTPSSMVTAEPGATMMRDVPRVSITRPLLPVLIVTFSGTVVPLDNRTAASPDCVCGRSTGDTDDLPLG